MEKEELKAQFEKNVSYLQKTIPPDDIYIFAEQTLMASVFFIRKLGEYTDLQTLAEEDAVFRKWLTNVGSFYTAQLREIDMTLDLKMDDLDG